MGKLSKFAEQCLDNFFIGKVLALEEQNPRGAFSNQMRLDTLLSEIKTFIELRPSGAFHVRVYDEIDENENDPVTLHIMNCARDDVKFEYLIIIDPNWNGYRGDQIDETGDHRVNVKILSL